MTAYEPLTLKRWTRPQCYIGAEWDGWFVFLGQHRDSDTITRSNFEVGLAAVRKAMSPDSVPNDPDESATVQVVRESHWAVGWVEWIAIHESDTDALKVADELVASLEDYPVLNEEHLSNLEYTEASDYWRRASIRERVDLCQRARISVFAARRDELPDDDQGNLMGLLRA